MAVEISVALLPASKPKVWVSFQFLFFLSNLSQLHLQQDGETSTVTLGKDTLNANSSCLSFKLVFFFFCKTIRIDMMHVLRMHVTETEETQELRIIFVLCFAIVHCFKTNGKDVDDLLFSEKEQ